MKFKKKTALAVALALVLVLGATTVFALAPDMPRAAVVWAGEHPEPVQLLTGAPGKRFEAGDLVFALVSPDAIGKDAAQTLSGDAMSVEFEVTASSPYAELWLQNSGTGQTVVTVTKASPAGETVNGGIFTLASDTTVRVSSPKPWPTGKYFVNFTSAHVDMEGTVSCRVVPTLEDLAF